MTTENTPAPADPWETQRALMRASGQEVPAVPTFTNGAALYVALVMEEAGETIRDGLAPALARLVGELDRDGAALAAGGLQELLYAMRAAAADMHRHSLEIREQLARIPGFSAALTLQEAVGALDGVSDVTVVNCGLALACGLPGAAGYAEVAGSNWSKRNPDTGGIDRDAGGKWIHGRDFRAPDLGRVLTDVFPAHRFR